MMKATTKNPLTSSSFFPSTKNILFESSSRAQFASRLSSFVRVSTAVASQISTRAGCFSEREAASDSMRPSVLPVASYEMDIQGDLRAPICMSCGALQGHPIGCRTGNGEKVSSSQAEPGQAINSAVV